MLLVLREVDDEDEANSVMEAGGAIDIDARAGRDSAADDPDPVAAAAAGDAPRPNSCGLFKMGVVIVSVQVMHEESMSERTRTTLLADSRKRSLVLLPRPVTKESGAPSTERWPSSLPICCCTSPA